jgi:hypothetical protein
MGVGISGWFLIDCVLVRIHKIRACKCGPAGLTPQDFFTTGLTDQLIFREEGEGRRNDSGSLDKEVCTTEILFSCQVCVFISSRD